jgi:MinD-like ATPase involved in chromosome partitioning or flagellar assembly
MSTIIFTAGAKGGTGKSTATRFMVTCLRERQLNPLVMDLDDENRTISRFFPESLQIEIKKKSSHDVLVEKAMNGESLIIADLKAGTGREVLDWWLDVPFDELKSVVNFVCVASITSSPDSVQSFLHWVLALQDQVTYIVFKNLKDGDSLPDYELSNEAIEFRKKLKPYHVVMPRLDEEYATELERLNLTIAEVLDPKDMSVGPLLGKLMVKARLRRYQQNIYEQINPILDALNI